jgi:hypothetical protein
MKKQAGSSSIRCFILSKTVTGIMRTNDNILHDNISIAFETSTFRDIFRLDPCSSLIFRLAVCLRFLVGFFFVIPVVRVLIHFTGLDFRLAAFFLQLLNLI